MLNTHRQFLRKQRYIYNIVLAPAVAEWGLPTEPWVFVVGADGVILGRFEGLVTREELRELLA